MLAGVAGGYMASMLLSVVIGGLLGAALPTNAISIGGGLLFVVFAVISLRSARGAPRTTMATTCWPTSGSTTIRRSIRRSDRPARFNTRVVASIAAAMFVAELGDKTMLATATLAAKGNPVLVWFGATVGIMLAGTVGVVIGRWLGDRLPERVILIGSSVLFLVFGIVLIVSGILGAT